VIRPSCQDSQNVIKPPSRENAIRLSENVTWLRNPRQRRVHPRTAANFPSIGISPDHPFTRIQQL
jgi:hypothetical protein